MSSGDFRLVADKQECGIDRRIGFCRKLRQKRLQRAIPIIKAAQHVVVFDCKASSRRELRKRLDAELSLLPEKDLEDSSPLPIWFRVYLRKQLPELQDSGPYQYPRTAGRILQWMINNPNSDQIDAKMD